MNDILCEIQHRQKLFAQLPFFKFLEEGNRIEDANIFAPGLSFFVLSFQDMLRINEALVSDPELLPIIQHYRQGDLGHDLWFLHDIHQLGETCNASLLFGQRYTVTRDVTFEIMSEIFRASDDRVRLVVPLAMEATAFVFFSRVYKFFARSGFEKNLKFFSKQHFQAELDHELSDQEICHRLQSVQFTDELISESSGVVQRIFAAFSKMVCDLHNQIENHDTKSFKQESKALVDDKQVENRQHELQLV